MTRRPTSCRSAATASSSRSAQPTARPISSAARWVASAWTRKRSGFSSQPPLDSKKSKIGAVPAIASTPEGLSTSTASGTPADATGRRAAAVGEAQDGDRQGDIGLDRFDQLADARRLSRRGADHPLARLDQDREALDRLEGVGETAAGSRTRRRAGVLGEDIVLLDLAVGGTVGGDGTHPNRSSAVEDVRFNRPLPKMRARAIAACRRRDGRLRRRSGRGIPHGPARPVTRRCQARRCYR